MKAVSREIKWITACGGLGLILVMSFQNCAPSLPNTAVGPSTGAATTRPTPLPMSATPPPVGGSGSYTGLAWEGTCVADPSVENMAIVGSDGAYPLIVSTRADGAAAIWSGSMAGIARGVVCKMSAAGWSVKATGDLNANFSPDIIWRNTDGRVAVWTMFGASRIGGGLLPNMSSDWNLEAVLDTNADLKGDLLWRNRTSGALQIWLMDGLNITSQTNLSGPDLSWHLKGVGDFDRDYKADLFWVSDSRQLSIMFMNGAAIRTTLTPQGSPYAVNYAFKGAGDYDGDGKADLLWQNTSDTTLAIWKLDASGNRTEFKLGAIDPTWTFEYSMDFDGDSLLMADWMWTIPSANGPLLASTRVANGIPQSTKTFNLIRSGWTLLKPDRY